MIENEESAVVEQDDSDLAVAQCEMPCIETNPHFSVRSTPALEAGKEGEQEPNDSVLTFRQRANCVRRVIERLEAEGTEIARSPDLIITLFALADFCHDDETKMYNFAAATDDEAAAWRNLITGMFCKALAENPMVVQLCEQLSKRTQP